MPGIAERSSTGGSPELALAHLDSLPTLAPIAVSLLRVASSKDSGASDLVRLLRGDQSLAARVLAVANSAAMGLREEVRALDRAVVLLGFNMIRNIVLAVKVLECFERPGPDERERRRQRTDFWKHALGVACAARRLAQGQPSLGVDAEEAFLAGLTHDLGKVALDCVFPKAYARVVAQAELARGDIADHERALLGIDHTAAGRRLAERWKLPAYLRDTIWLHHIAIEALPTRVDAPRLLALVQLADTLVREQRIGASGNFAFYESSSRIARHVGIDEPALQTVAQMLAPDVAEHVGWLGLDQETPETLYLQSLTRANSELSHLNTQLVGANHQLAVGARYFRALTRFDLRLSADSEFAAVVAAIADAATVALQRPRVAAFALPHRGTTLEVCTTDAGGSPTAPSSRRIDVGLRGRLDELAARDVVVTRAPRPLCLAIGLDANDTSERDCWLLAIAHQRRVAGGVVFCSPRDELLELSREQEELRAFLTSLGLAVGRANAYAAAQRLSEDLAESNRRLQQAQVKLLRSRTLSMIAEMAAGAGHELNSPLTVISGRAQMIAGATEDEKVRRDLELIQTKAHECSRIVTELMDFARPAEPQHAPFDLAALLATARERCLSESGLAANQVSLSVPEELRAPAGGVVVIGDRGQWETVVRELLNNAVEAVADNHGTIAIRVARLKESDLPDAMSMGDLRGAIEPAAGWYEITVRDTGRGMSADVLERVFDPFFSHRSAGRRRGLGLPRAYRIVEGHGGRIHIESRPGTGATVHIYLPTS